MRVIYPSYYHDFSCWASSCPDTCCKGWKISIDRDTYGKYMTMGGLTGAKLRKHIDHETRSFRQIGGRCPFLDRSGLCGLCIDLGEDMMCRTCRSYPRHGEPYGDRLEISLSLSCPAAAELILDRREAAEYREKIRPDRPGEPDCTADRAILRGLVRIRTSMFRILKREPACGESMSRRAAVILALAHDGERRLKAGGRPGLEGVCDFYEKQDGGGRLERELSSFREMTVQRRVLEREYWSRLSRLEPVSEKWEELLSCSGEEVRSLSAPFHMERNLLEYFLYLFYAGGVYDRNGWTKAKLAVFGLAAVRLLTGRLAKEGLETEEAFLQAAGLYSKQLEHSDRNLADMEAFAERDPACSMESLLACLLGGEAGEK